MRVPSTRFTPHVDYQLALVTPGISPRQAISRKHIRHSPNRRKHPRRRPHRMQRRTVRVVNFGGRLALLIHDVFAINVPSSNA